MSLYLMLLTTVLGLPPAEAPTVFGPRILVRARKVARDDPRGERWFVVEHVYCGDPKLKGRAIHLDYLGIAGSPTDVDPVDQAGPGEVGVWLLKKDKTVGDKSLYWVGGLNHFRRGTVSLGWGAGYPVPARKSPGSGAASYREGVRWAETVSQVACTRGAERIALLKKHCLSDCPSIAAWCIYLLREDKPVGLVSFLESLATNEKLCVAGQVAVDEVLCALDSKRWPTSKKRQALLKRWVAGDIIDWKDFERILLRLRGALEEKELSWQVYLPLVTKWYVNQELPFEFEDDPTQLSSLSDETYQKVRPQVMQYALDLLRGKADDASYRVAFEWLKKIRWNGPLKPTEVAQLKAIQRQAAGSKRAQWIDELLTKPDLAD